MKQLVLCSIIITSICFGGNEQGGHVGMVRESILLIEEARYTDLDKRLTLRESAGLEAKATIPGTDVFAHKLDSQIRTVKEDMLVVPKGNTRDNDVEAIAELREKLARLKGN